MTLTLFDNSSANVVYQYNAIDPVRIRGTYDGTNSVEVAIINQSTSAVIVGYMAARLNSSKKLFSADIIPPAGSNYVATARYVGSSPADTATQVQPWHVGLLIVLAGQSQMTRLATPAAQSLNTGVVAYEYNKYSNTFAAATEAWEVPTSYGLVALANKIAQYTSWPIGILNAAEGGTAMATWVSPAGANSLKGFLREMLFRFNRDAGIVVWGQGEQDVRIATSYTSYYNGLGNMKTYYKNNLLRALGYSYTLIVCHTGQSYFTTESPLPPSQLADIRNAQADWVTANAGAILGPDFDSYTHVDGIHLTNDAAGQGAFGTDLGNIIKDHL